MDTVEAIAHHFNALHVSRAPLADKGVETCRIVARAERQQELIDQLQGTLRRDAEWRITIFPIEATVPEPQQADRKTRSPEQATREELYAEIERDSKIDSTFLLLVILSTIVATIGLLENNVALIIAAMLIAPLLGPNVAMAFGSTLGDRELIFSAVVTNTIGVSLSVACAAVAGRLQPVATISQELLARTTLGYDSIILALASGAAGALSLTTRLESTLVGVMVAVALLPPAVTLGFMLGARHFYLAGGAATLLAVNIVCVNLSAQVVFLSKGIKPRTWIERRGAKQSVTIGLAIASSLLAALVAMIYWKRI
jgi:uncharacterized hydrophobic protein (TIGR00341 family)